MITVRYNSFGIILQTVLGYSIFFFVLAISNNSFAEEKTAKSPSLEACEYVVSYANKGQLDKILIPSEPWDSTQIKVPTGLDSVVFRKLIDINNDGIMERVFVESGGTMHWEHFAVYEASADQAVNIKTSLSDDWESNNLRWALDQAFVQFKGVSYVLGKTNQSLHYLAHINQDNEMKVVCEFGQREQPLQSLKTSQNDKVCKQALEDSIDYVEFNKLHSISRDVLRQAGFHETGPSEKAAMVDIDNDGKKEVIVSLELTSGAGRGCDSTFLGVLTANRENIDKQFTEKLPGRKCGGTKVAPFVVDGKTYLDEREPSPHADHMQVYMLDKDQLKTICEFEVRPDNYVLSSVSRIEQAAGNKNPWEYAISQPGTTALETLINVGRDVNEDTGHGVRPLNLALQSKREDLLEILLKAGANPNLEMEGMPTTPLTDAVWRGSNKAVELLLKYGAKAVDKNKPGNYNALSEAIDRGTVEKLELLLRYGTEITDAAAMEAITARSNKYEKLRLLVKYGLDVNKTYTFGGKDAKTLLQWAKEIGDPEVVKVLLETGAKGTVNDLKRKLQESDAILNQAYQMLADSLTKADKQKLRKEQRAWILERNAKCGSSFSGKSMDDWLRYVASDEKRASCVLEATQMRTKQFFLKIFPEIVPPDETVAGQSQAEWSRAYRHWERLFPKDQQPDADTTGSRCAYKQSDQVWFLAGYSGNLPVIRQCEIHAGQYIFLPVLIPLDIAQGIAASFGITLIDADETASNGADIYVEIDGRKILNDTLAAMYAISHGYWMMLKPLSTGKHTIKFGGRFPKKGFSQNVQYNIIVK